MSQDRLIQSNAQTSDANGQATFRIGPAEQGLVYQGTVQIPNSPSGALFVATVLSANWGQFAGPTNFGPIQLWGGETLTVTATGLTPNTNFVMTYFGVAIDENSAIPIPPSAPESVVTVETATKLVDGVSFVPGTTNIIIHPPTLTRRLTIEFKPASGNDFDMALIKLVGVTTGIVYFQEAPNPHGSTQAIPEIVFTAIEPAVDATYSLIIANSGAQNIKVWVVASSTNPLILGQDSNPLSIEQPITVQGIGPTGSVHNPVWVYRFLNSVSSILPASGVATQLVGAPPAGSVNMLGMMSIGLTAGCAAVTLTDGSGNVLWSAFVEAGIQPHFTMELLIADKVNATVISGQTVRVTMTYDQMPIVSTA